MKIYFLIPLFFLGSCAKNMTPTKYKPQRAMLAASTAAVSGFAWGIHEKTMHDYIGFKATFPKANDQFWNPQISWRNKYVGLDPAMGRNRKPIWITDAKHLLASSNQTLLVVSGATITFGEKRMWWHYALDIGISFGAYSIGNWVGLKALYR